MSIVEITSREKYEKIKLLHQESISRLDKSIDKVYQNPGSALLRLYFTIEDRGFKFAIAELKRSPEMFGRVTENYQSYKYEQLHGNEFMLDELCHSLECWYSAVHQWVKIKDEWNSQCRLNNLIQKFGRSKNQHEASDENDIER